MTLSDEILDDIDGGDECRGRDSKITAWAESAKRLERQRDELLAALREVYAARSTILNARVFRDNTDQILTRVGAAIAEAERTP